MIWTVLALAQVAPAEATECRAAPAQELVGERYRRRVPTRAKRLSGARTVRVIWPGQMMTMDFRADRVNLRVNYRRLVTAVSCG
jgi:hypothetical protein